MEQERSSPTSPGVIAAAGQCLYAVFGQTSVKFTDVIGQFGVTSASPACLDVSALINQAIDFCLGKVNQEHDKLQWLLVVHYVESLLHQFSQNKIDFALVLFENKARNVDPLVAALHSAILHHLEKNTQLQVAVFSSARSREWTEFEELTLPSFFVTEYPPDVATVYNAQCYATIWCLCRDAVPVLFFDSLENHSPRLNGFYLDARNLDTSTEEPWKAAKIVVEEGLSTVPTKLEDVGHLSSHVPSTLNVTKTVALLAALAKASITTPEEKALAGLFLLQGLFTDSILLEDMCFRGVVLPSSTSAATRAVTSFLTPLWTSLQLFPLHQDGVVPNIYDGKVFHTLLTLAHLPSNAGISLSQLATSVGIAEELTGCKAVIDQLNLSWLLEATPLGIEASPAAEETFQQQSEAVQREVESNNAALHPLHRNKLFADILLEHQAETHTDISLVVDKLDSNNPWEFAGFVQDHALYLPFSKDDESDEPQTEVAARGQQEHAHFLRLLERFKAAARKGLHHVSQRDNLEKMIRELMDNASVPRARVEFQQCLDKQHWAGAVGVCQKYLKRLDTARFRQRQSAFNIRFAKTLLGKIERMNLDPKPKSSGADVRKSTQIARFQSATRTAERVLKDLETRMATLRAAATTAARSRSDNKINECLKHLNTLFLHENKPINGNISNESNVRELLSESGRYPKAVSAVAAFDKLNYRNRLWAARAEAAVIQLETHTLRLDCFLENEEARGRMGDEDESNIDPCVLSHLDHLVVAIIDIALDILQAISDPAHDWHAAAVRFHVRTLTPLFRLGFTNDVEALLSLWQQKLSITTTMDAFDKVEPLLRKQRGLLEFQLRAMGPFFERPAGRSDPRSPFFKPDDWQVQLLNAVDDRRSALISAPTSSGKTFISFYAMEKVLKAQTDLDTGSNKNAARQMVVYVSPTKALVNQTVAEIEGRYEKTMKLNDFRLAAAFTQEYGYDYHDACQVLVTVPECFEYLLLQAGKEGWKKNIKWVIFDEVHSIALNEGFYWERLLTLIDCPFLALSATIGDTEHFMQWLERLETARLLRRGVESNEPIIKIEHTMRWNDLDTWYYDGAQGNLISINPLGMLSASKLARDGFPPSCRLLPEHCSEIWACLDAWQRAGDVSEAASPLVRDLDPTTWFPQHQQMNGVVADDSSPDNESIKRAASFCGRIKSKIYTQYEQHMKQTLERLAKVDLRLLERTAESVGERTDEAAHHTLTDKEIQNGDNLLDFLRHLRDGPANRLPALLFHLDATGIQKLQAALTATLQREQNEYYFSNDPALGSSRDARRRRVEEIKREKLDLARERVERYRHELEHRLQHTEDAEARAEQLQALVDAEIDRQLDLLWDDEYQRMNDKWLEDAIKSARVQAKGTIQQMIADGGVARDPLQLKQLEDDIVEAHIETSRANRIADFCLTDRPVSLDDLDEAFPKKSKAALVTKIEEDVFYQALRRGIGVHFTEQSKDKSQAVERLFRERKLAVVISTDTLALGISMPCRTVVFYGDNPKLDSLNYHQMSGRAGRRGHDIRGHVMFYGISKRKISRLLASPLRAMFPNIPLDSSIALRATARYQQSKVEKEAEEQSIRRLLCEPYAALNKGRETLLPIYVRAQLEVLARLHVLSYVDLRPQRDVEAERESSARAQGTVDAEQPEAEEEPQDEVEQETLEDWEDWLDEEEEAAEVKEEPDAPEALAVQDIHLNAEKEGPASTLDFENDVEGPYAHVLASLANHLAYATPSNLWFTYLLQQNALDSNNAREPWTEEHLLKNMLHTVPHERMHPTHIQRVRERLGENLKGQLVLPPMTAELQEHIDRFKTIVFEGFLDVLRHFALSALPEEARAEASRSLVFSAADARIGGNKKLPGVLEALRIRDPLRLATAAASGEGYHYATRLELLHELQHLPGLSLDLLPVPVAVDERDACLQGALFDIWKHSDQDALADEANMPVNLFYVVASNFHRHLEIMHHAVKCRDIILSKKVQAAKQMENLNEVEKRAVAAKQETSQQVESLKVLSESLKVLSESLKVLSEAYYERLKTAGLIWS
eukprot:m.202131 g.202131  ORF g.202131 m.202131 type:complete len:2049 (-) comp16872_c5_seq2:4425-10571(-)